MDISVSSPGSPGTSFTDNVKEKIIIIHDVLEENKDFASVRELGTQLEPYGFNWNYTRNILPFLQNCGIINYQNIKEFENKKIFTNIGQAYVSVLRAMNVLKAEHEGKERNEILERLDKIEKIILFQCLIILMKNKECNYSKDFFDVLCFTDSYGSIDATEYLLIQYERAQNPADFMTRMSDYVERYREGSLNINVSTKTKNDDKGEKKSVNSFPYVHGNFTKAGVFYKGEDNRFFINEDRRDEVDCAISEVKEIWKN
jgi:hypothetical protein